MRITRIGLGFGLIAAGLVMLVVPGPGIVTIASGLAVLARDFKWARSTLDWVKDRFKRFLPENAPNQEGG